MMKNDEKDERKNFFLSENFSALDALNSDDTHDDADDDYLLQDVEEDDDDEEDIMLDREQGEIDMSGL